MIKENPYRQTASVVVSQDSDTVLICADPILAAQTSAELRHKKQSACRVSSRTSSHNPCSPMPQKAVLSPSVSASREMEMADPEEADPGEMLVMPRHNFSDPTGDSKLLCVGVLAAMIGLALFLI